jgi:hypothetical protein
MRTADHVTALFSYLFRRQTRAADPAHILARRAGRPLQNVNVRSKKTENDR